MRRFLTGLVLALILVSSSMYGNAMEPTVYDDGWIKVSPFRPDVYRIEEYYANCYLVVGTEEAVLIDTAYGAADLEKICRLYTQLPITVINTHGHFDHIGGNQYFQNVYIHQGDAPDLEKVAGSEGRNLMKILSLNLNFPKNFEIEKWYASPTPPRKLLSGGENLKFGDIRLDVISTPGHTPGSICLVDRGRRLLFTGDSFNLGKLWTSLPEDNLGEWLTKTDLRSQIEAVLPGHRLPLSVGKDI